MDAVAAAYDGDIQLIDSSSSRVHQHAAGTIKGPDRCMGCLCRGLTTKVHAVIEARVLPIRLVLTAGQTHDSQAAAELLRELSPDARQSWAALAWPR